MFELGEDQQRKSILNNEGHLLIMGGPGSGKTTIALFKAQKIVQKNILHNGQKILFLSFARATISRVEEQAGNLIQADEKSFIEINTYHGFIWNILKHHGYLLSEHPLHLLPPHEASKYLIDVSKDQIYHKLNSLFYDEGLVHFDMFAPLCTQLLTQSYALRKIISQMYPIIILDEFQDTNMDEWNLIKLLGADCRLIALADPDQRIYDFRGADPERVAQYIEEFKPSVYDFGQENNRSNGTDIVQFGNDLLSQNNKNKHYTDVSIKQYPFYSKPFTNMPVKVELLSVINRLNKLDLPEWSVAILVPTNALMAEVSDCLSKAQTSKKGQVFPEIKHEVAIDAAGSSLAALFVAYLLETGSVQRCSLNEVLKILIEHILGRKGNGSVTKADIAFAKALEVFVATGKISGKNRKLLINDCRQIVEEVNHASFSGNIIADWNNIVKIINTGSSPYLVQIANDIKYIRLLRKGSQLYSSLDDLWRETHTYSGAHSAVSNALTQEHFAMSTKKWTGVNVMTIHKAKGKEFDEVIIYEGLYQNRLVSQPERIKQARLNLRVAATRAKRHTTILTPQADPCPLL